jgi:hypothetical protein
MQADRQTGTQADRQTDIPKAERKINHATRGTQQTGFNCVPPQDFLGYGL